MKNTATTEQEMRDERVQTPASIKELSEYIESLTERDHDYGTCVYAMSMAATAAFNHVASKLGVTGFQASCADLDVIRRTRMIKGPFLLLKAEDMIYPQYDLEERLRESMESWKGWLAEDAKRKLQEHPDGAGVHPNVRAHWEKLAAHESTTEE